jgi:hypothetical protein
MEKTIKVSFNRNFYSLFSIKKSVQDYNDVADFIVKRNKNRIDVSFDNFDEGLSDNLGSEFSNYVLFIEATKNHEKTLKNR